MLIGSVQKNADQPIDSSKPLPNNRRELFCQLVSDGLRPSEAYKKAYKCSAIVAQASTPRMLKYADVKARIDFLRAEVAENNAQRRRRKLAVCENIWCGNDPNAQVSDKLRAIDIDNKMCGDYEPAKIDLGEAGDALAAIAAAITPEMLEEAAKARKDCFERIRMRAEKEAAHAE